MSAETMLTVEGLNKTTENGILFSDMTFSIPKKGVHGILAPRGAGKTTLLEILAGWDDDFEGEILLGETSLAWEDLLRKRRIGYLPASPVFDSAMTVEETLVFAGRAKRVPSEKLDARITEALELVGLFHISSRLCANLNAFERRRLSMAVALVGNPKLFLIDEPTAKLGGGDAKEMWELVRMLGDAKTVLIATDRYEEAVALCDDLILMADGRILAVGTQEELEAQLARSGEGEGLTLSSVYASLSGGRKEGSR